MPVPCTGKEPVRQKPNHWGSIQSLMMTRSLSASGFETNTVAGWSSLVAREAHNLEVVGSNPAPATLTLGLRLSQPRGFFMRRRRDTQSLVATTYCHNSCYDDATRGPEVSNLAPAKGAACTLAPPDAPIGHCLTPSPETFAPFYNHVPDH